MAQPNQGKPGKPITATPIKGGSVTGYAGKSETKTGVHTNGIRGSKNK